jgi:magnesium-protoporphyrin IX monomethyl ester (oxidative) cyclase
MVAGQFDLARRICGLAKAMFPGTVTAVGGAHVSQFSRQILENCPEMDFVATGEGELQVVALARFARTRTAPARWPDGLAYRGGDGEVVVSSRKSFVENLDELPQAAYDLVRFEDYRHDTSTWHNPYGVDLGVRVPVITSRGCPYGCSFCSVQGSMGRRHRPRSATNVANELQMLYERHGSRYFAIFDANFAQDPRRVISLCAEIERRRLRIHLDLPTGLPISRATEDMIDALSGAGLIRTCISVESGDEHIRNDVMGKHVDDRDIFRVVGAIRRHPHIFLLTDFVLGMPEDTAESVEASCELIRRLDTDDICLSLATPYPGTSLYEQCVRDDLFLPDIALDRLWESDSFAHTNVNRFTIRTYALDVSQLGVYRDRILALRQEKLSAYRTRMRDRFGVQVA